MTTINYTQGEATQPERECAKIDQMGELSEATKVWNRACMEYGGTSPSVGDVALAALLAFDSLAMNGGVLHALECLSKSEVEAAAAGYRFFGHEAESEFVLAAAQQVRDEGESDELEFDLDDRYVKLVELGPTLDHSFQARFAVDRHAFSPIA